MQGISRQEGQFVLQGLLSTCHDGLYTTFNSPGCEVVATEWGSVVGTAGVPVVSISSVVVIRSSLSVYCNVVWHDCLLTIA